MKWKVYIGFIVEEVKTKRGKGVSRTIGELFLNVSLFHSEKICTENFHIYFINVQMIYLDRKFLSKTLMTFMAESYF